MDADQQTIIWEYRQADQNQRLDMIMYYRELRKTFISIDRQHNSEVFQKQNAYIRGPAIFRAIINRFVPGYR